MNDAPISQLPPTVDSVTLRERLTREFEDYHGARRRQRLLLAAAAASVSIAMLTWGLWARSGPEAPEMAVSPVSESAAADGISRGAAQALTTDALGQTSTSSAPLIAESEPRELDPSRYPHMRLKILGEDELVEELERIESEKWFLVRINGEVTAFSETERRIHPPR